MIKKIKNADTVLHTWAGQDIQPGEYYSIQPLEENSWANNSDLLASIANGQAVVNDGSNDIIDINTAIIFLKNGLPKEVVTQYEKNDKDLKLCKAQGDVDPETKTAVMYVKIPGTPGDPNSGRWMAGGEAILDSFDWGDHAEVYVEDKDRMIAWGIALAQDPNATEPVSDDFIKQAGVLPAPFNEAFPEYPTVKSFTEEEVAEENKGWFFYPESMGSQPPYGILDVTPIGGYGFGPPGFYLKIIVKRPNLTIGTARINVFWGKKAS